jgi:hypothetical protein
MAGFFNIYRQEAKLELVISIGSISPRAGYNFRKS